MEEASPARLYASLVGAILILTGIGGFFYSASFGAPGEVEDALGAFAVNGWSNVLQIATGALGLLVAGFAARSYALCIGGLYVVLGAWGFLLGSGEEILGFLPVDDADSLARLGLGALGLAAAAGTPALRADPARQ